MSGEERAFIDHIIAEPDDDAPRLVFADWLDEQGRHERAEFIRVQCERARLPEWDARQVRLAIREEELQARLKGELAAELPDWMGQPGASAYRRGFLAVSRFDSFEHARYRLPTLAAVAPVEAVRVSRRGWADEVERLPLVPGVRELRFESGFRDEYEAAALADSPFLSTLRVLDVRRNWADETAFRRLLTSPHLRGLRALRMPFNSVTSRVPRMLADTHLTALEELDISGTVEYAEDALDTAECLADLIAWPGLAGLRVLALERVELGAGGLRVLLASPHCAGLKSLSLFRCGLDADACAGFADAPPGLRLDSLDLGDNMLTDAGPALAGAACLSELKELNVLRSEIGPAGAAALAGSPFAATLRVLKAEQNSFGTEGLRVLLASAPPHLHTLDLTDNDIDNAGAAALADSPASDAFLDLALSFNKFTDAGLRHFGASPHLRSLVLLTLGTAGLGESAWQELRLSPLGRRLGGRLVNEQTSF